MTQRLLYLVAALACISLVVAGHAFSAPAQQRPALRVGYEGQRVKDLQWLLSGHRPSVYRKPLIRTYDGKIDGVFGARTRTAVLDMKWRLGYKKKYVTGKAGRQLFEILTGKRARPLGWIGRASMRVGRSATFTPILTRKTPCATKIVAIARREVGVHEVPMGSNNGPRVHTYQTSTGAYRVAWCASFSQWTWINAGAGKIHAPSPAYVFSIVQTAHANANLHAVARAGAMVAYLKNAGHIGIVERVTSNGFYAIEGNYSDSVARVFHHVGDRQTVFIWPPATCSTRRPH